MITNTKKRTLLGAAKLLFSTTAIIGIALSSSAAFAVVSLPAPLPPVDVSIPAPQPPIGVIGPGPSIDPIADDEGGEVIEPIFVGPPIKVGSAPSIDQSDIFDNFATNLGAGGNGLRVFYTTVGNSQNLANISPAAGGNSAEALAGISPAAGGNDNAVERTESSSSDSCWAEGASRSAAAFGANITTNFDDCQ